MSKMLDKNRDLVYTTHRRFKSEVISEWKPPR